MRLDNLLYIFLILYSCSEKGVDSASFGDQELANDKLDLELFSANDTMKVLKLDYNLSSIELDSTLEKQLNTSFCWSDNYFGLKLANGDNIKVNITQECYDGYACVLYAPPSRMRLQLNGRGNLWFDKKQNVDSIKYIIRDRYLSIKENERSRGSFDVPQVKIEWRQETPSDSIEKVVIQCKEGFRLLYQDLASKWFNKTYYQLDKNQLDSILHYAPFNICLDFGIDPYDKSEK